MVHDTQRRGALVLRLMVGLALLGCPGVSSAQGAWSVIATRDWGLGPVWVPTALAADAEGNLYVADDFDGYSRIQKRDARGNWFVVAASGTALGQVYNPTALAVDTALNLYVADHFPGRIQKRDAQGSWSAIDAAGGHLHHVDGLAVDASGDLYVADKNSSTNSLVTQFSPEMAL